jgi:hypothetical protein
MDDGPDAVLAAAGWLTQNSHDPDVASAIAMALQHYCVPSIGHLAVERPAIVLNLAAGLKDLLAELPEEEPELVTPFATKRPPKKAVEE